MERWALISGLRGDLDLYEALQRDLKRQRGVKHLFALGDFISPSRNCDALLNRLQNPKPSDIKPDCIYGWWEEQLLAELGYRGDRRADALREQQGESGIEQLIKCVGQEHHHWLASLQYGFIELDCALIHASSADVGDELTSKSSPLLLLDRLTRLDVNRLFTARSGQQFRLELTGGTINSKINDPTGEYQNTQAVPKRSVIGIGSGAKYTLYDPGSDRIDFLEASNAASTSGLGFS